MRTVFTPRRLALGLAAGLGLTAVAQDPPAAAPAPLPAAVTDAAGGRPVAYINGNEPITRQELGDFLIARGGHEKLELLVNKKIIEAECAKKGVTVTEAEMMAALVDDVKELSIKKEDFIRVVLPRYNKSYYEWMEDVIRPRLLLTKLCRERVTVAEADIKKQFEREYGEKRKVQIIGWAANDDMKGIMDQWGKLRADQAEFDRVARSQANVALAASTGHIKPITRHLSAHEQTVEKTAFELRVGETSGIITTGQGYLVMKLHAVIPPDSTVKFEDVKPRLEKQAYDELIATEIPKYFAELKEKAQVNLFSAAPAQWKLEPEAGNKGLNGLLNGVIPAGAKQPAAPEGGK